MSQALVAAAKAKNIIEGKLDAIVEEFDLPPQRIGDFKVCILRLGIDATIAGVQHIEEIARIKAACR